MKRLVLVATLLVFAGCAGVLPGEDGSSGPELPPNVGEVDNVSYDEELSVDASDGLSEAELDPFVRRTMARVEVVRERPFARMVDIEVITRAEYREEYNDQLTDDTRAAWRNQLWEGLFIIGEERDAVTVLDEAFGAAVQGFYDPGEEQIVIVSDEEEASIDKVTLVHELVHALQDQQFGLGRSTDTWDADQAYESVIEGSASIVPDLYLDRCSDWGCLRPGGEQSRTELDPGVYLVIRQPYETGAAFVEEVRADGGWEAVDDLHEDPPDTSTEVIHPDRYPEMEPAGVEVADRSSAEWSRFDHDPVGETLGEGSIFAMFAANGVINPEDPQSYDHPASAGWAGDRFVPYRNDDEFGYVWETRWQTPDEASEFHETYEQLLDAHDALARGANTRVIQDGSFEGAFRVTQEGDSVRIVHAPTISALGDVHAPR